MQRIITNVWNGVGESLDTRGFAHIGEVLSEEECIDVINHYPSEQFFRSTIHMQRYRFGEGEYKYFNYPLPALVQSLREEFYKLLVPAANNWMDRLGMDVHYPQELEAFLELCHTKNQKRPTPLVLRYEAGGYNTLHQDMYGEIFFPFQVVFMLTQRGKDYEGGELVFVEQLPRAQSRAHVLNPNRGDAIVLTTNFRPVKGAKGHYRARMKHGVSSLSKGIRYTMGLIFHDAA